jgi:nitrogenase subunit NifH
VHVVALVEKGFGQIEAVLSGDPGDECAGYAVIVPVPVMSGRRRPPVTLLA